MAEDEVMKTIPKQGVTIRARPSAEQSVSEKYMRLISVLERSQTLAVSAVAKQRILEFGSRSLLTVSLSRVLPRGVSGAVRFSYRSDGLDDDAVYDDVVELGFGNSAVFEELVGGGILLRLVDGFHAYRAEVAPTLYIQEIAERQEYEDRRREVAYISPVSFYDGVLCERAFSSAPSAIYEKLTSAGIRSEQVHGGVFIVGAERPLDAREAESLARHLRAHVVEQE